ncbi:MAG: hypothetical protein ABFD10_06100 [Prolixibacteraceae bacterium]
MKQQIEPIPASYPAHVHSIHYLRVGNTALYKPYADMKGIHCAGDRFGYIVDWQVTEKKGDYSTTTKAPH